MVEGETPPPLVAANNKHRKYKQQKSWCTAQRSGCQVQRSGPASVQVGAGGSNNMQLQPPPPPTNRALKEFELSALTEVAMSAASYTPPAPVLILSWLVVVVVVGVACCCCIPLRLALMLTLTFAPAPWPLLLVLAVVVIGSNLRWWRFSLSHWHKDSTCTCGSFTHSNLRRWWFSFHLLVQIPKLRSSNLHCVVVVVDVCVCDGGSCRYWVVVVG